MACIHKRYLSEKYLFRKLTLTLVMYMNKNSIEQLIALLEISHCWFSLSQANIIVRVWGPASDPQIQYVNQHWVSQITVYGTMANWRLRNYLWGNSGPLARYSRLSKQSLPKWMRNVLWKEQPGGGAIPGLREGGMLTQKDVTQDCHDCYFPAFISNICFVPTMCKHMANPWG